MFDKNILIYGKHAQYIRLLAPSKRAGENKLQIASFFDRYIDVLLIAPLVGYRYKRENEEDHEAKDVDGEKIRPANILLEQVVLERDRLEFSYRLIMLLSNKKSVERNERINRAFRYDRNEEKRKSGDEIYRRYLLGGIEVLYEKLIKDAHDVDDYVENMFNFWQEYNQLFCQDIDIEELLKLCGKSSN